MPWAGSSISASIAPVERFIGCILKQGIAPRGHTGTMSVPSALYK